MIEEYELKLAEIAKDLTIAVWQNETSHAALRSEGSIPQDAHPMADFEEVLAQLRRTLNAAAPPAHDRPTSFEPGA